MRRTATAIHRLLFPCAVVVLAWQSAAAPPPVHGAGGDVPDPDPEIERRSFQVADGFEVNVFAADPLLAKPIQMNFDSAGRLWVACSAVYPQIRPGQAADDKIIVLEDADGDGRADRTTVFADGLLIPTGLEPGDGGVYVAASTELLHLRDTDGDGKADRRRVVLSGFGTEDTHHLVHTLRWGPDGMLYFNQSVYIHSHVETPYGVRRLGGGGIWQFRPETMQLEVFARGFVNPWGHHFDRWGQSFATDGANGEGINYVVPGASYAWAPGATRVLSGLNPGSPKHCGVEVLSGRHLPEDWRGNLITNDFRGHRVCRFVVRPDGSGYSSQEKNELIKTAHPAFRPVDVKMGPDGAVYVADWYNPIINHGEVDFRDPRRDHVHGRIWRVTAKGRPLVPRPKLVGARTEELLEFLKSPEDWTRHHAKRVLKERGPSVLPALGAWVKRLGLTEQPPGYEHHLLEALWTYQSLDVVEPKLLDTLLHAHDYRVRAAATRVVAAWHARLARPADLLAARVVDDHPQVRLEAVRGLAKLGDAQAAEIALRALDRPTDRFLDYALWLTAREQEPSWLPAVQKKQMDFGGNVRHLLFAFQAVGTPAVAGPLSELVQAGKIPAESESSVLAMIATLGGPGELAMILDTVLASSTPPGRKTQLLAALLQANRQRGVWPAGDLKRVGALLTANEPPVRAAAARAAGLWHVEALHADLVTLAKASGTDDVTRQGVFDGLVSLGGKPSRDVFFELSGSGPAPLRLMALRGLAGLDLEAAARRSADMLSAEQGGPAEIVTILVQFKDGPAALAGALAGRKVPADAAKIGIRSARASGRDHPALVAALTKAGGLTAGPRVLTDREMRELMAEVARRGDPARGEAVFRRSDQACLKCHSIAGAGGLVGPDLVSIGASAPVDYLIDSILQPNKAVKENYHSVTVTTQDGKLYAGIPVRQTATELVLRDAEDREVAIPLKAIDEKVTGGSLMPEGLADTLTRAELIDLVRFLSELGKVGPYAVGKTRVARRWEVLAPTPAARRYLERTRPGAALPSDPALAWVPVYSKVSGDLPLEDVPRAGAKQPAGLVRCQLDVSTGGKVKLVLNSAAGLALWVDGAPVTAAETVALDLTAGMHRLTFAVDPAQRREGLRCEVEDVPASPARVRVVAGK